MTKKNLNNTKSKLTMSMVIATILLTSTLATIPSAYSQTILFQDDYSSNVGWTQVGTDVTVDSPAFPGVAKFDNARDGGGVTEKRVFKQIPSTLPADGWIAEFDYKFTASSIPSHFPFALTATSIDLRFQSPDRVLVKHGGSGLNQLQLGPAGGSQPGAIPISANIQYYVTLERVPTQLILSVFSDPARTIHIPNSPFVQTIAVTDFTNINFIQHSVGLTGGPARTLTAEVDNTVIFADVQQNQAPDCSVATPSQDSLFPPNHKMNDITISGVTDPDGDAVTLMIDGITQDEPTNGKGDGNTSPDGDGVGTDTAQIRAERSGTGDGRVYEISFTADDGNGGMCTGMVSVGVPHDKKSTAVDSGQNFDSTQ